MIETPKIPEEQQKQFRYEFVKMIEEYNDQDALDAFRAEWDGAVNFEIHDDHTVIANIAGEEKLPESLKAKTRALRERFQHSLSGMV